MMRCRPLLYSMLFALASASAPAAAICSVATTGVAFGSYDPVQGHNQDINGMVTVTCAGTVGDAVSYKVTIDPGRGSYHSRQMIAGNQVMHYNLFLDPARSLVWGDGTQGTGVLADVLHLTAPSVSKSFIVFGRILNNQQKLKAQTYFDNLVVSITY